MDKIHLLIDGAPQTVKIGGKVWPVYTDFRVFLLFEEMECSPEIPEPEKLGYALAYFYPQIPDNFEEALDRMLWFYRCGEEEPEGDSGESAPPVYSFSQDAGYIYAAFWERYRIDLTSADLHWWKFNALLKPLVSGVDFSEIIKCRATRITRSMGKAEASYYRKMKKLYALRDETDAGDKLKKSKDFDEFKDRILSKAQKRQKELQKMLKG